MSIYLWASRSHLAVCIVAVAVCVAIAGSPNAAYGQPVPYSPFVTTWETTTASESITIPVGGATGTYTVDWGDGSTSTQTGDATHEYESAGTYTVTITGNFTRIVLGNDFQNTAKLQSIDQWGSIQWDTMESAFSYADNMKYNATDIPDLSGVTNMSQMFRGASSFNGDISGWDVSSVTNMSQMFSASYSFNGDISGWDVSSVTDMSSMFHASYSFNQPLGSWDVSSVTNMSGMFFRAYSFNQPLTSWNTSSVTDMSWMFHASHSFNQQLNSWDVSSVTDMSDMFREASSFNQPLGSWDVSSVTDMSSMFHASHSFNQPLASWDVSSVTDMSWMFSGRIDVVASNYSFNQPLASWDVSSVTSMIGMFRDATSFNQPLSSWDVSSVTDMSIMFADATAFDQPLEAWDVSNVEYMYWMFRGASSFNQPLASWDVSSVTDMTFMFSDATAFDQNLGNWYIVLGDAEVYRGDTEVTTITAQNAFLDGQDPISLLSEFLKAMGHDQNAFLDEHDPTYSVSAGGDGDLFEMSGDVLRFVSDEYAKSTYEFSIISEGGFVSPNSRDVTVTVTDGTSRAAVMGTLFYDYNGNGVQDEGEAGAPGQTMRTIDLQDGIVRDTVTDADGTYAFEMIVPSPRTTLVQTVHFPFDHTVADPGTSWFTYVQPEASQTVTFDVWFHPVPQSDYVTLDIMVYSDDNANGALDAGEGTIPDVTVHVYTYTTNEMETAVTGPDGTVSKTDLTPSDFLAQVTIPDGYATATSPVDPASGVPGALTVIDPAPGSRHTIQIGLAPS